MASPLSDARKLQQSAIASADELREFLRELRGKSPKEMLGEVSSSSLARSTVTASVGAAALIAVLTILPFAWSKLTETPENAIAAADVDAAPVEEPTPARVPASERVAAQTAAEKLGIGEQKEAPAAVNPLDSSNTDLLDGLE